MNISLISLQAQHLLKSTEIPEKITVVKIKKITIMNNLLMRNASYY